MTLVDWFEYILVNLSAAAAIAIDACILVLLKFRDLTTYSAAFQWAGAVGLTHVLFPMVGFMGGWLVIERYHLAAVIYPVGASLIGLLIYLVLRESIDSHPEVEGLSTTAAAKMGRITAFWISVMYVSLDALLSGPGKTVFLDRYPKSLAWLSFLIVGLLVALFTLIAGGVSCAVHTRWKTGRLESPASLAQGVTVGIIGEIVLFSFFLVWGVVKTLDHLPGTAGLKVPLLYITLAGTVIGGIISATFYSRIKAAQLAKAALALASFRATPAPGAAAAETPLRGTKTPTEKREGRMTG